MIKKEKNGVVYYEFENIAATGIVKHCFSTRIGGLSSFPYDEMNLAYHMGDDIETVAKNFQIISDTVGFVAEDIILTNQIHEANYHVVTDKTKPHEVDSLITNQAGYTLTSYYADCVPLLFVDPVKRVIANAHAGWKGTVAQIGKKTVAAMQKEFGCAPLDIVVGVGPAICQECFEVGDDVARQFSDYPQHCKKKENEKWHIDLIGVNVDDLVEIGIRTSNIEVSQLCTFEEELFFSHRRLGSARGNMAAMIMLKE